MPNPGDVVIKGLQVKKQSPDDQIFAGGFSVCGRYLGLLLRNKPPRVLDLETQAYLELKVNVPAAALAFHPKEPEVAFGFGTKGTSLQRFDLANPNISPLKLPLYGAISLAYDPTGRFLAAGTTDSCLVSWDLDLKPLPQQVLNHDVGYGPIIALAYHCSSKKIFMVPAGRAPLELTADNKLQPVLKREDGRPFNWDCYTLDSHRAWPRYAFAGEGSVVYLLREINANGPGNHNSLEEIFTGADHFVRSIHLTLNDGLISIVTDKSLEVWSTFEPRRIGIWNAPQGRVLCTRQSTNPQNEDQLLVAWGDI